MSVHETDRHELWLSLCDTLGESRANTLMTMLPMQPVPELATRADMAANRDKIRELHVDFGELRSEFGDLRSDQSSLRSDFRELRSEMSSMRSELLGEMALLRGDLRAEIARSSIVLGLSLGTLIIAVLGTILTLGFSGAFAP